MPKKPLVKYNPNSPRSRLVQPLGKMPNCNTSNIIIGDRGNYSPRSTFTTTTQKNHINF